MGAATSARARKALVKCILNGLYSGDGEYIEDICLEIQVLEWEKNCLIYHNE